MASKTLVTMRALRFAAEAHVDQRRKGKRNEPYINHLVEVAHLVAESCDAEDCEAIAAAFLHDSIENTGVTHADLVTSFGKVIADIVLEVSDDKKLGFKERKALQIEKASSLSQRAKIVKLADKTSNIRSLIQSPPTEWSTERLIEYAEWAESVVAGCRGVSPYLEARFDEALTAFRDVYR